MWDVGLRLETVCATYFSFTVVLTVDTDNSMLAPHIAISHGALICTLVLRHHSWIGVVSDGMVHDSSGTQPLDSTQLKIVCTIYLSSNVVLIIDIDAPIEDG